MYRRGKTYTGPTLPRNLLDKFEDASTGNGGRKKGAGKAALPLGRKDKRKQEREHKKYSRRNNAQIRQLYSPPSESDADGTPQTEPERVAKETTQVSMGKRTVLKTPADTTGGGWLAQADDEPPPEPAISKMTKERLETDDAEIAALEKKLGLKGKKLPKSFDDDGLGDLLEGLGEVNSKERGDLKRRRGVEDDEWLARKRNKRTDQPAVEDQFSQEDDASTSEGLVGPESEGDSEFSTSDSESDGVLEEPGLAGDSADAYAQLDSSNDARLTSRRVKENPYVAPPTADGEVVAKYIPPSRRSAPSNDEEATRRLRRQTQGLLNRLSESNLISIVNDFDKLYQSHPRQYVTSALVDLLLTLICDRTKLNDTFVILHAAFISAMYKIIGPDFGAQILEGVVQKIDHFYALSLEKGNAGKDIVNLTSLLAQLFNFQVISCDIVFDYIRTFLSSLTESHTELLLRIVRSSGPQLRQDDPAALKDIVALLQKTVAATSDGEVSVRTQFMIETINDLKNNRLKSGAAGSSIAAEHSSRLRKTLGSLNSRSGIKATEPLRIPLQDVRNAEKTGKWWLIGASWRGNNDKSQNVDETSAQHLNSSIQTGAHLDIDSDLDDIAAGTTTDDVSFLAHKNGMNNPLRRSIFSAIISASDYRDAQTRLLKLHLSRAQEREIPRVLLHCVGAEKGYNAYYALIARQLCAGDRRVRAAFQFALWDFLKRIGAARSDRDDVGENEEDSDDEDAATMAPPLHTIVNHAKLYGSLIVSGTLSITVLKVIDLEPLVTEQSLRLRSQFPPSGGVGQKSAGKRRASTFLEVLLIAVLSASPKPKPGQRSNAAPTVDESEFGAKVAPAAAAAAVDSRKMDLDAVFRPMLGTPALARGLGKFVNLVVRSSDLVASGSKERRRVKTACEVVSNLMAEAAVESDKVDGSDSDVYHGLDMDGDEED